MPVPGAATSADRAEAARATTKRATEAPALACRILIALPLRIFCWRRIVRQVERLVGKRAGRAHQSTPPASPWRPPPLLTGSLVEPGRAHCATRPLQQGRRPGVELAQGPFEFQRDVGHQKGSHCKVQFDSNGSSKSRAVFPWLAPLEPWSLYAIRSARPSSEECGARHAAWIAARAGRQRHDGPEPG